MKTLVENFIKITNINYEDQTEKIREKTKAIEWQFHIGTNVIVSKNTNRADRIHLNVNMRFTPDDAKLLIIKNPSFSKAVMEISEICTICNVGHQWVKDKENIVGLAMRVTEIESSSISFTRVAGQSLNTPGPYQQSKTNTPFCFR